MNNHYNGSFLEPWGERAQRGYGIEVIERFAPRAGVRRIRRRPHGRAERLEEVRGLDYNDLSAERQTVAAVQALEAILDRQAKGEPDCVVRVNDRHGGLVLYRPGSSEPTILYAGEV